MASPMDEREQPVYPTPYYPPTTNKSNSDEEGTIIGDENGDTRQGSSHNRRDPLHLNVNIPGEDDRLSRFSKSPSQNREQAHRLDDDLKLLQVERQVSAAIEEDVEGEEAAEKDSHLHKTQSASVRRERSKREELVDDFDVATNPLHERAQVYKPPENPASAVGKFFKRVHNSSFLIRYITYITPVTLILLIPLLIGALVPGVNGDDGARVGGVQLLWFMIWLEIVWLTLWAGRVCQAIFYTITLKTDRC